MSDKATLDELNRKIQEASYTVRCRRNPNMG